jgi:hypothetical protein
MLVLDWWTYVNDQTDPAFACQFSCGFNMQPTCPDSDSDSHLSMVKFNEPKQWF